MFKKLYHLIFGYSTDAWLEEAKRQSGISIELGEDLSFYDSSNWGTVEDVDHSNSLITIKREEWAPGIWAGSENATIKINQKDYVIRMVDLNNRILKLDHTTDICPNNTIDSFH